MVGRGSDSFEMAADAVLRRSHVIRDGDEERGRPLRAETSCCRHGRRRIVSTKAHDHRAGRAPNRVDDRFEQAALLVEGP